MAASTSSSKRRCSYGLTHQLTVAIILVIANGHLVSAVVGRCGAPQTTEAGMYAPTSRFLPLNSGLQFVDHHLP